MFCIYSFNPRTHVGCDALKLWMLNGTLLFQSTHPRRVRREPASSHQRCFWFQSTHPRRVRRSFHCVIDDIFLFQSTHPRRVRPEQRYRTKECKRFQSTHPRRVRLGITTTNYTVTRFNPRTHVGCDALLDKFGNVDDVSIHAPT